MTQLQGRMVITKYFDCKIEMQSMKKVFIGQNDTV